MPTDLGTITATPSGNDVVLVRELLHPTQTVWAALTDPAQIKVWLMEISVLELRVGGPIGFSEEGMGEPGAITELKDQSVLEYTWTTGHPPPPSIVRFELEAIAGGTRLRLIHSRNPEETVALDHAAGWHTHLDWLNAQLDESPLPDFWPRFNELRPLYASR